MGIALRHDRRFMPQEPLHLVEIHSALNHSRGAGMPKIMEMEILFERARSNGLNTRALQMLLVL